MQCLRVGSTINRGPPDTNFVGESNPTSPKLTHTLQKLNTLPHEPETQNKHTPPTQRPPHSTPVKETQRRGSHHRIQHRPPRLGPCNTKTSVQYTNEGDPAQEGTEQEQNEHDAQIRAMQHKTSVQYTNQGDPAQEDMTQNKQNAQIRAMQHRTQPDKTVKGQGKDDHQRQWRRHHGRPTDGGRSDDGEQTEIA